jgi:hypothetical protein
VRKTFERRDRESVGVVNEKKERFRAPIPRSHPMKGRSLFTVVVVSLKRYPDTNRSGLRDL